MQFVWQIFAAGLLGAGWILWPRRQCCQCGEEFALWIFTADCRRRPICRTCDINQFRPTAS